MSFSYFSNLNYTLANEDSTLEMEMIAHESSHVVSVAGSGARGMALLKNKPKKLTFLDLSPEQIMLAELRIESMRALEREEYLAFWGYPLEVGIKDLDRRGWLDRFKLQQKTAQFFSDVFSHSEGESILYQGRWERTFAKVARGIALICRNQHLCVFDATNLIEQREIILNQFPKWSWEMALTLIGNGSFFNGLLYKGHFPKLNVARSHYRFYNEAFGRLFHTTLARENFFLQIVMLGRLQYPQGLPVECHKDIYPLLRANLASAEIQYAVGNAIPWISNNPDRDVDFVSLSDVPSYFSEHLAKNFLQDMRDGLKVGARVVIRSYLQRPVEMLTTGYVDETNKWTELLNREMTQMYMIDILAKVDDDTSRRK